MKSESFMENDLKVLARRIVEAQDSNAQLTPISSSTRALTMNEAYDVSWLVHEERLKSGWRAIGRKIGFTNRDMWVLFGVTQPVWSFVYDRTYEDVDATFDCPLLGLVQPRIEPEIVFCLRSVPSAAASEDEVLDCIEWMAHGIEMVQCHYPDWKFTSTDAVCDSSFHGKLFVGDKRRVSKDRAAVGAMLKACEVSLYNGRELVEVGYGRNVLGSPLSALSHLLESMQQGGSAYPLLPGEVITTGTITKAYSVRAGERWRTEIASDDFAGLTINFV